MIPYGKQSIDEDDIGAVVRVLKSDWLTQGPRVEEFEEALAHYCGAQYAVAVSSGTAALHLACLAAGIKKGDEVITTPLTFVATANSVVFCDGKPILADIRNDTYNIDPQEIIKKIGLKTKALIPVDFAGLPCDIENIHKIAKKHNLVIIEDGCHALGAMYRRQDSENKSQNENTGKINWGKVGSCEHSDMTVFSFHPVKHITTGEGGAILTNNYEYYEKLKMLRSHGITKDRSKFGIRNPESQGDWYYEMQELGFNYRITDLQCALGLSQMKKLDRFVKKRRAIASQYNEAFQGIKYLQTPPEPLKTKSSYHLYVLLADFSKFRINRADFVRKMLDRGVGTQVHYIPVHLQPYYRKRFKLKAGDYPVAEDYYSRAISLPLYPAMRNEDVKKVVRSLKECLNV